MTKNDTKPKLHAFLLQRENVALKLPPQLLHQLWSPPNGSHFWNLWVEQPTTHLKIPTFLKVNLSHSDHLCFGDEQAASNTSWKTLVCMGIQPLNAWGSWHLEEVQLESGHPLSITLFAQVPKRPVLRILLHAASRFGVPEMLFWTRIMGHPMKVWTQFLLPWRARKIPAHSCEGLSDSSRYSRTKNLPPI